ncbi:hypothetical protein EDD15DRAFT_2367084 [Pisolithus albus]|nr:hypothetical protein EDD15DRAFT_2367084 [Pisolithus albus]
MVTFVLSGSLGWYGGLFPLSSVFFKQASRPRLVLNLLPSSSRTLECCFEVFPSPQALVKMALALCPSFEDLIEAPLASQAPPKTLIAPRAPFEAPFAFRDPLEDRFEAFIAPRAPLGLPLPLLNRIQERQEVCHPIESAKARVRPSLPVEELQGTRHTPKGFIFVSSVVEKDTFELGAGSALREEIPREVLGRSLQARLDFWALARGPGGLATQVQKSPSSSQTPTPSRARPEDLEGQLPGSRATKPPSSQPPATSRD